jgi:hypothetical protein
MPENHREKSGENSSNLNDYFHRELMKNLSELNALISVEQGKRLSKKSFIQAGVIIEDIHDLSMVHGFDSIEAISEKLAVTALQLNHLSADHIYEALANIRTGLRAILDILKISTGPVKDSFGATPKNDENIPEPDEKQGDQFFDIKEIDSLMQLVEEPQETPAATQAGAENSGLEQAFEDVFREEAQDALDQFKTALTNLKMGATTENRLRLKSALFALRDATHSYKVSILEKPIDEFIAFCETELQIGLSLSPLLAQRLEDGEKILRAFVAAYPEQNFNHPDFSLLLKPDFQNPNSGPANATEPPESKPEKQLQIKAKISVTKEEIRRRWILKKH